MNPHRQGRDQADHGQHRRGDPERLQALAQSRLPHLGGQGLDRLALLAVLVLQTLKDLLAALPRIERRRAPGLGRRTGPVRTHALSDRLGALRRLGRRFVAAHQHEP
jgi:hypothetical protein